MLEESRTAGLAAHDEQTKLLSREAGGDHVPVDILLVHSQDHLMTAMLCQDLPRRSSTCTSSSRTNSPERGPGVEQTAPRAPRATVAGPEGPALPKGVLT